MKTQVAVAVLLASVTALASCAPNYTRSTDAAGCPVIHTKGSSDAAVDWEDLVNVEGRQYIFNDYVPIPESEVGDVVASTRCQIVGNVDDPDYKLHKGDATYLAPGTQLHAQVGHSPRARLVAFYAGHWVPYDNNEPATM